MAQQFGWGSDLTSIRQRTSGRTGFVKKIVCSQCSQLLPINDMVRVMDRSLCVPCAESHVKALGGAKVPQQEIGRYLDPTICAKCGVDNGSDELATVRNRPLCAECENGYRNRPYPVWLKWTFLALVALMLFSFALNWRFMAAYRELRQAQRAMKAGDIDRSAALLASAADHVPESTEIADQAAFCQGVSCLAHDQSAKALQLFRALKSHDQNPAIDRLLISAEAGVAFDSKNYDEFLARMKSLADNNPHDAMAVAGVASAYACKYAVTGDPQFRQQALDWLLRAEKAGGAGQPPFIEYQARIRHRLDTREIISREEYQRRFADQQKEQPKP